MPLYNTGFPGQSDGSGVVVCRVNDTDFAIPWDTDFVLSYAQTATRTFTLPAGASVYSGKRIVIRDAAGMSWFGMPIIVQRSGSDLINGQSRAFIEFPYGELIATWDAATGWSCGDSQPPRSDSWYLADSFGFPSRNVEATVQPIWTNVGTTIANVGYTNAGGLALNISMGTGATSYAGSTAWSGTTPLQIGSGAGTYFLEILSSLDTLMNNTDGRFAAGFMVGNGVGLNSEPQNGVYLMHNPATHANWLGRTAANGVRSTVLDSGVAVATANFHRFAVKLTPGAANFAINRNMFGSIATNIPSGSGQKLSFGTYSSRNNVNAGSQAFNYNLYGFRFLYLPPSPR